MTCRYTITGTEPINTLHYLLSIRCDPNNKLNHPFLPYPIFSAIHYSKKHSLRMLLEYGANPNLKRDDGDVINTPLLYALRDNKIDMAIMLLKYGAVLSPEQREFYHIAQRDSQKIVNFAKLLVSKFRDRITIHAVRKGICQYYHYIDNPRETKGVKYLRQLDPSLEYSRDFCWTFWKNKNKSQNTLFRW